MPAIKYNVCELVSNIKQGRLLSSYLIPAQDDRISC
jgi:hypothetical protein